MSTIAALKSQFNTAIRIKSVENSISTDDVADQLDSLADEINKSQQESLTTISSGTSLVTVYTATVAANLFSRNGDKMKTEIWLDYGGTSTDLELFLGDGTTTFYDQVTSGPVSDGGSKLELIQIRQTSTTMFVGATLDGVVLHGQTITFDPTVAHNYLVRIKRASGSYRLLAGFSTLIRAAS